MTKGLARFACAFPVLLIPPPHLPLLSLITSGEKFISLFKPGHINPAVRRGNVVIAGTITHFTAHLLFRLLSLKLPLNPFPVVKLFLYRSVIKIVISTSPVLTLTSAALVAFVGCTFTYTIGKMKVVLPTAYYHAHLSS